MIVLFDGGAASRGVEDDGIQLPALQFGVPYPDVVGHQFQTVAAFAHVEGEGTATAHCCWNNHFRAQAGEQAHGGIVDLRAQYLLGATG